MLYTLDLLGRFADGLARQFEPDYEIVVHDLKKHDLEHSIMYVNNGHVTNRRERDGPSRVVLEILHKSPTSLKDRLGYLTRTSNGGILKSSTIYIRNKEGDSIDYLLSINYGMTGPMTVDCSIKAFIDTGPQKDMEQQPKQIVHNINDLLDILTKQSMTLTGKPAALMNKKEKITAIQFLDDADASLITKSENEVSRHFGISKFTLYNYINVSSRKSDDKKA